MMAKVSLWLHASKKEQDLILSVRWSGESVDHRYVDEAMELKVELIFSHFTTTGRCPE